MTVTVGLTTTALTTDQQVDIELSLLTGICFAHVDLSGMEYAKCTNIGCTNLLSYTSMRREYVMEHMRRDRLLCKVSV